jgi:hypothetical protein
MTRRHLLPRPRPRVPQIAPRLAGFESLLSKCFADALVAHLRKEAAGHGVDVLTWLARDKSSVE